MSSIAKICLLLVVIAAACVLPSALAGSRNGFQSGYNKSKPESEQSHAQGQTKDGTLKLSSTVVNIAAVVTDRSGKYAPKLTKDDFELSENGAPQQIAFFSNEEVPFNVCLLIDVSQSVSSSLKDIKKAAIQFVNQLRPSDKVMVAAFDQREMYLTDFTNDRKTLESAINGLQTGRGTSVYEAVYDTVASRFRGIEGRKALLLMSDGEDTSSSRITYDQAIARVAQSDILVYGLRYPDTGHGNGNWGHHHGGGGFPRFPLAPESGFTGGAAPMSLSSGQWGGQQRGQRGGNGQQRNRDARDFMKDVTEAGGGPLYDAKSIGDVGKMAPQIADELRHVYVIGYYPTKPLSDGGYRTVDVKLKGHDDLSVRHRTGYDASQTAPVPTT
jgi:Ca-activated chloride channel family protein